MSTDITIVRGDTFLMAARWEQPKFVYATITGITQTAPVSITATAHGVPNGWRVAIQSVKGMTDINASDLKDKSFLQATVVDANTIELNTVNAIDFKPYTSGGVVVYRTPVDLAGYTARMQVRDKVGGTLMASSEAGDSPLNIISLTVDATAKTVGNAVAATDTAALTWKKGYYDLEMVSAGGKVTKLLSGTITVSDEVTTV